MNINISQVIIKGHLTRALRAMEAQIQSGAHRQELRQLTEEYNRLQEQHLKEIISWDEYREEREQLSGRIAQLARRMGIESIPEPPQSIDTPILAITHAPRLILELEDFFTKFSFTRARACFWEEHPPLDNYSILVFDNTDLLDETEAEKSPLRTEQRKKRAERELNMEYCIHSTSAYLLHYGNNLSWVSLNRARAHAANSKFALYARLKELIDFIEAYRV